MKKRFEIQKQLKFKDASGHIWGNEMPNKRYIEKHTDLKKHLVIENNPRERILLDQIDKMIRNMM